jgi:hypothetical protein
MVNRNLLHLSDVRMLCSYTLIISGALASSIGFKFYGNLAVKKAPLLLSFY